MQRQKLNLKALSGLLLVAGALCLPVTSQAGSYTDYITYRFISSRKSAQLNQQVCTYQSIQSQQQVELTLPYVCWPMAFQSRMDGQFYKDTD
ncbi:MULTISPECIES: hypothetical protein [Enterobacteriaceae]|uniref:hypothetical protein n=1 Tax=Enterobacteriaceae TaxID=543 RepID=UPI000B9B4142|nr:MULTISPECIES: hypothetical protein [Enterobacteriaceae]HBU6574534.1 hypothetical protein [Citrobacter amalonaticus]ELP5231344.1 hypothetical protein [Citrobacter freundii]MBA8131526.1 hypothetical protein [Citrobacter sp. RHBSTW-00013]MBJ8800028.1 hypothetical protein [Citrobacter freundii]MCW1434905.1 hypothetical protein [Citrobacter freundii]